MLVRTKDILNQSWLVTNRPIQNVDSLLLRLFDWTRLSVVLNALSRRIHTIVAQRDERLKHEMGWPDVMPNYRSVSTITRFGFVSLSMTFIIISWLWFSGFSATGQGQERANTFDDSRSLAVVNPDNITQSNTMPAEGESTQELPQPIAIIAAAMTPKPDGGADTSASVPQAGELTGELAEPPQIMQLAIAASSAQDSVLSSVQEGANAAQITVRDMLANNEDQNSERRTVAQLLQAATPTETATPEPSPTPTEEDIPSDVPQVRLIPMLPIPSDTPTGTPTNTPTITPTPLPLEPGSLWSTFIPGPPSEVDHFWVRRPFPTTAKNQTASTNYQFGSTAYGRYRVHHGLDMSNPIGTPILAAVDGEVIHAGIDDPVLLAPFNNFYGNTVVIRLAQRLSVAGGEVDVFLLYGHLNEVTVVVGQQVTPDVVVGMVGMTGIAIGPHLHIEMRVGTNTYDKSVNPYLWMQPKAGTGVIALRLLTSDGRAWPGARVSVLGLGTQGNVVLSRHIDTYLNIEQMEPDPRFGENGAIGSLPPGTYILATTINGERIRREIVVRAGETTFVEIRTQQ